jgi:hypothetical protein
VNNPHGSAVLVALRRVALPHAHPRTGTESVGYRLKEKVGSVDVLTDTLSRIAAGEIVIEPVLAKRLVDRPRSEKKSLVATLPAQAWTPAYQARKPRAAETGVQIESRDGVWVAEASGLVDLSAWPPGTRLILRKERPHPGAQLRTTDADGMRITGFLTNTPRAGPLKRHLGGFRWASEEDPIEGSRPS